MPSIVALVLLLATGTVQGQSGTPRRFEPYAPFIGRPINAVRSSGVESSHRTYAIEGAIAGGAGMGVLGAAFSHEFCRQDSSDGCLFPTLYGAALGALIGVVVGGLVGSFVPKGAP